jgi:hypothetical protein
MSSMVARLGNHLLGQRRVGSGRLTEVSRGPPWLFALQRLILGFTLGADLRFPCSAQRSALDTP